MSKNDANLDPFFEKNKRINKEKLRLKRRYKTLPKDSMDILEGLIDRAAFLRVTVEDMEADIKENGTTEFFTQSEKLSPYERERPVVRQHVQYINAYQKIIKQLDDKLEKNEPSGILEKDDGFGAFLANREAI